MPALKSVANDGCYLQGSFYLFIYFKYIP